MNRRKIVSVAIAIVIILAAFTVLVFTKPNAQGTNDVIDKPPGDTNSTDPGTTPQTSSNTTLEASKCAQGFWEVKKTYDWCVQKSVEISGEDECGCLNLGIGEYAVLDYDIAVTKTLACDTEKIGVRGFVNVKNTGTCDTEGLRIIDKVQVLKDGTWVDLESTAIDISSKVKLAAGESFSYPYEVLFTPCQCESYRNLAYVTITNFVDHAGTDWGVNACASFTMPCEPKCITTDECATVSDEFCVPDGFSLTCDDNGPWEVSESQHIQFQAKLTNLDAPNDRSSCVCNKATLIECDTGVTREACANVCIKTGCGGCTNLEVDKSASGWWERDISYQWTITKEVDQDELCMKQGDSSNLVFTIKAVRSVADCMDEFGVQGKVHVSNIGVACTENLKILDEIWYYNDDGDLVLLTSSWIDTTLCPVLEPGQEFAYPYDIEFVPVDGVDCYINVANVTIDNFEGEQGCVQFSAQFCLPEAPSELCETNECAMITDELSIPEGFSCDPSVFEPVEICESTEIEYTVKVTNVCAEPCGNFVLCNLVTLKELDTCQERMDSACVCICVPCQELTTLSIDKTIKVEWIKGISYDWTITKVASIHSIELAKGDSVDIIYTITVNKTLASTEETVVVSGLVTVTNTGTFVTEGLDVGDILYVSHDNSVWHEIASDDLTSQKTSLAPGESFDYAYSFDVTSELEELFGTPLPDSLYFRNYAEADITNYVDHSGSSYGPSVWKDSGVVNPTVGVEDDSADVSDLFTDIPSDLVITGIDAGPWTLTENETVTFTVNVMNEDALCSSTFYLNNTATLIESDSGTQHTASESVVVTTPECTCGGCTLTIGYWKNHLFQGTPGGLPSAYDVLNTTGGIWLGTPNGAQSIFVADTVDGVNLAGMLLDTSKLGGNQTRMLLAQLLGAKLNMGKASDPSCPSAISGNLTRADTLIAQYGQTNWDDLPSDIQAEITDLASIFASYNEGTLPGGPPHCDS